MELTIKTTAIPRVNIASTLKSELARPDLFMRDNK
jgi:hypothetical protein